MWLRTTLTSTNLHVYMSVTYLFTCPYTHTHTKAHASMHERKLTHKQTNKHVHNPDDFENIADFK